MTMRSFWMRMTPTTTVYAGVVEQDAATATMIEKTPP
jgi:hypothetical protein